MDFETALTAYLARLNTTDGWVGNTRPHGRVISAEQGRRWVRLVATDEAGQRSAVGFVDPADGSIWAPDGWKRPRRNFPRGNVYRLAVAS